jgi:hypothetical protein
VNDAELTVEIDRCVQDWHLLKVRIVKSMQEIVGRNEGESFLYSKGFYFMACAMVMVDKALEMQAPPDFVEWMNNRLAILITEFQQSQTPQQVQPHAGEDEWPELFPETPIL